MIKRVCTVCALAIAALSFTGMAVAANNSGQSSSQNNTQQLMKTYRSDAQQLQQIHKKAVKNNPQLAKEQQQFQDQVKSAIKKQGYDVNAGQKRMQSMAQKLQSGNLSDQKRKQVMQNFQQERQKMVKARNKALSNPGIQKSGQKLQKDTISAMKKQNPKTTQLISEMRSVRSKLQQQQSSGGSNNGNG